MDYIGARYVPKFMGNYDATQSYEALCVVDNGSGTSYISKIPTPPGTPLTNTTYWAVYGASSGAIYDLQTRMQAAENDIININDDIDMLGSAINVKTPSSDTGLTGAVGDGVTDDTAAINAIMQYALQHDLNVYFPKGEYLISSITIEFTSSHRTINIFGDGKRSMIKCSGSGITLINTSENTIPNYSKVSNLYFYGMDITTSRLLNFVNVYNGYIENCLFERGLYGLSLISNIWVNVLNCRFNWAGQDGVYMCGSGEDNRALYVGNNAVNFIGCVAQMNGHSGYYCIGSSGCNFYGCTAEANTVCGIQIEKSGGFNGRGFLISGCWFEFNPSGHIYIDERYGATEVNHSIESCGFVLDENMIANTGIVIIDDNAAIIVQGCHFRRVSGSKESVIYKNNLLCVHNRFSYTPTYNEIRGANNNKTYVRFSNDGTILDCSRDVTSVTNPSTGTFEVNVNHHLTCAVSASESNTGVTATYINNKVDGSSTIKISIIDTYNGSMNPVNTVGNAIAF